MNFRAKIEEARSGVAYLNVFMTHFAIFKENNDLILLMAYLTNQAQMHLASSKKKGWFFCTVEKMERELHWNYHKQRRNIKQLEAMGIIRTKQIDFQGPRYVRILWQRLLELEEQARESKAQDQSGRQGLQI